MARCESVVDMSRFNSNDAELLIIESNESQSEGSSVTSDHDINEDDYNTDLPGYADNEKPVVNAGPVLSLQCLHEDDQNDEDSDDNSGITPVKIVSVTGMESEIAKPQSSLPVSNNWEGVHNFKIKVQCNDLPKKSESTMFSEVDQKLYVAKDHPFKILVFAENVPSGARIRTTAVFSMAEHSYEPIKRCPTHAQADFYKGNPAYEHFVQCFNSNSVVYTKHPDSGKMSVSVPYEKPQEGELYTTYLFKLTCFSSCSGGINRRPFVLVFTLEKDNIPLGRQTLEAKVCACPVRDYKVDQNREHKRKSKTDSSSKFSSDGEGATVNSKYTISVRDPDLYIFLKQMKCFYQMSAYSSKMKPDT